MTEVAEEFIRLHEDGQPPDLDGFCARYPESRQKFVRRECEQILRLKGVVNQHTRLSSGQNISSYEIVELIGKGGMGEVYRARDHTLDREVAIKVLPADLAYQPARVERFEREAKAIAGLDHPNIVTVHSVEQADRIRFLTMELVEGEALSARIPKKGFSLEKFFDLAIPMAEAVSAAHQHGVTHRDLKPANIMVTNEGRVKVLDFGLARLRENGTAQESSHPTNPPLTEEGSIVGTAAYMSPEQAEGEEVDHRSDIFSLGIVLYEMATGERPFKGDTRVTLASSIVKDTPRPIHELNPALPRHLGRIVRSCLSKNVAKRYQTAADVANQLAELKREIDSGEIVGPMQPLPRRSAMWPALASAAITALGVSLIVGDDAVTDASAGVGGVPWPSQLDLPEESPLVFVGEATGGVGNTAMALSNDGRYLAFVGPDESGDTTKLHLREMDTGKVESLDDTEGAYSPFFSPQGDRIGFFQDQWLKKVSVYDRQVLPIAEANWAYGASWGEGRRIAVVAYDGTTVNTVREGGGELLRIPWNRGHLRVAQPFWLPDSEWILVTAYHPLHIAAISSLTGEMVHLVEDGLPLSQSSRHDLVNTPDLLIGSDPRYIEGGYLIYSVANANYVMGVRFDAIQLRVIGQPDLLVEGVRQENIHGALQLAATSYGDVVYSPGGHAAVGRFVAAKVDGSHDTTDLGFEPRAFGAFFLSADKRRIVAEVFPPVGRKEISFLDRDLEQEQRWEDAAGLAGDWEPFAGPWFPDSSDALVEALGATMISIKVNGERASGGKVVMTGDASILTCNVNSDGSLLIRATNPSTGASNLAIVPQGSHIPEPGALDFLYPDSQDQGDGEISPG